MTDTQRYPPLTVGTVLLTFATGTGMLLAALDANIVGTAMPTIVAQLGGLDLFSWVFSLYALVSTTAIPIFGRLSDVYGRKRLYLGGLAIFVLASILCGMSQSMPQLIAFRALQGVGGAAIFALVFAIVGDLHPPERRGQFQGAIASMWAISAVIGPGLGALITESIGWRWIFFVNVPVSLIPLLSLGFFLKEPTREAGRARVDALGSGLLAGGVFALLNAMLMARQQGQQIQALLLVVVSVLLIVLFVRRQSRVQLPTIPLELFRRRMVTLGVIASLTFGWAAFSLPAFVPLLAQAVTGGTALNAGAALTPMVFGWSIMAAIAGPLVRPLGYRTLSLACFTLIGIGYLLLVRIDTSSSLTDFVIAMAIAGAGCGIGSPAHMLALQNSVEPRMLGVATSLVMFFRNLGSAIGIGAMGSFHIWRLEGYLGGPAPDPSLVLAGDSAETDAAVVESFRESLALATRDVFFMPLALVAIGLAASAMMTQWQNPISETESEPAAAGAPPISNPSGRTG